MPLFPAYTYYFGRFNIIASYSDKYQFVIRGLRPGVVVEERGNSWTFAEVASVPGDDSYVYGYLVKYRKEFPEEIVNPITGQLEEDSIDNRAIAKSRFFLHVSSGMIAYHSVSGHIEREQFISQFCKLFERAHDNFFVSVEIQAIEENYKIFEKLHEFDYIYQVSFFLHPSNPNMRDLWDDVDNDIKAMGASHYREEYTAKPDSSNGLNINKIMDDKNIKGKFYMADDGYGKAKVKGMVKGEMRTITTGDNPLSMKVIDRGILEEVFQRVSSGFQKIFQRFEKRKDET